MAAIKVFNPFRQPGRYGGGIRKIVQVDVVPLERLHEGFSHALALRASDRRGTHHEAQRGRECPGFLGNLATVIICQPFRWVWNTL